MLNFVAIDFETANYKSTSACAVGLAVVRKGEVAETYASLIKPEPFWFVPEFIDIHNIRPEDVKDSPDFGALWPELAKRIKGQKLLAHNAPFDRGVLKACLNFYGLSEKLAIGTVSNMYNFVEKMNNAGNTVRF